MFNCSYFSFLCFTCFCLVLLLGHGSENLLHLVNDAAYLVGVRPGNFLDGVTHRRLRRNGHSQSVSISRYFTHIGRELKSKSRCVYLADGEGVPVQLLGEHESLCQHGFVVVGVFDDGRGGGVAKHLTYVTFKCLHHTCQQLLVPVEEENTNMFMFPTTAEIIRFN